MTSWILYRRRQLRDALRSIRGKDVLRVFQPFGATDTPIAGVEFVTRGDLRFGRDPTFALDIFFSKGYSSDVQDLVAVRHTGRAAVIACWFWDNHHLFGDCMRAAMLSDVTFYAHYYKHYYLKNELAIDGAFAPLCPIFWTVTDAEEAAALAITAPRSDALYGGYNSYAEFPQRDVFLDAIKARIPGNALFTTPHGTHFTAHPYYGKPKLDRLVEWMRYKVSLCVAFDGNMAMRIFDALLGGAIPLLAGRPADLDMVISPAEQARLPVLVVDDLSPDAVEAAYRKALALFDEGGPDAAMARHRYVLGNHMLHHRLGYMISKIREIAENVDRLHEMFGGAPYPAA